MTRATSTAAICLSASNPAAPNSAPRMICRHGARVPDSRVNSARKITVLNAIAQASDSSRSPVPAPGTSCQPIHPRTVLVAEIVTDETAMPQISVAPRKPRTATSHSRLTKKLPPPVGSLPQMSRSDSRSTCTQFCPVTSSAASPMIPTVVLDWAISSTWRSPASPGSS